MGWRGLSKVEGVAVERAQAGGRMNGAVAARKDAARKERPRGQAPASPQRRSQSVKPPASAQQFSRGGAPHPAPLTWRACSARCRASRSRPNGTARRSSTCCRASGQTGRWCPPSATAWTAATWGVCVGGGCTGGGGRRVGLGCVGGWERGRCAARQHCRQVRDAAAAAHPAPKHTTAHARAAHLYAANSRTSAQEEFIL